jgi:hypothetical protein
MGNPTVFKKLALVASVSVGLFGASGAGYSATFSNSSVKGNYAFCNISRGGQGAVAAWGVIVFDGIGRESRHNFVNVPAGPLHVAPPFPARLIVENTIGGTYRVNPDGTGRLTDNDGIGGAHFVITAANNKGAATEVFVVGDPLDLAVGGLPTGLADLQERPKTGFTNSTLQGEYAFGLTGAGGESPVALGGRISFNGGGAFERSNFVNGPERYPVTFPRRAIFTDRGRGQYAVQPDGTGRLANGTLEDGPKAVQETGFHFVILETSKDIATQTCLIGDMGDFFAGNIVTGTAQKR